MTVEFKLKYLEATQFFGDKYTGLDGEYSTNYKWLQHVIDEREEGVFAQGIKVNINDWIIFSTELQEVIDVCNDDEFKKKYKQQVSYH